MMTTPLIPAILLIVHTALNLSESLTEQNVLEKLSFQIGKIEQVPELIKMLQEERAVILDYIIMGNNDTWDEMVTETINSTDQMIDTSFNPWPRFFVEANVSADWIKSHEDFSSQMAEIRGLVKRGESGVKETLGHYNQVIDVLASVVERAIRGTTPAIIWKRLVAYISLVRGKELLSQNELLGLVLFEEVDPNGDYYFKKFISTDVIGEDFVKTAIFISPTMKTMHQDFRLKNKKVFNSIDTLKSVILSKEELGSEEKIRFSSAWANNVSVYLLALNDMETQLAEEVLTLTKTEISWANNAVAASISGVVLVSIFIPIVFIVLGRVITAIQKYVLNLSRKGVQIRREKKKSDGLLYQMLPKSVALQLKVMKRTSSETFRSVTIFFSDIVSFTTLSSRSTPLQVVDFLNNMYNMFDSTIERYDVYKVETIGDAYMVASGVPQRNGHRHAGEIGQLALDLMEGVRLFRIPHMPEEKLRIRVGVHTGPVVAGVVGSKMPRYCLFGETVEYASLMESQGVPMKIQLSLATKDVLDQLSGYLVESRGEIDVKGHGKTETFFLRGRVQSLDGRRSSKM